MLCLFSLAGAPTAAPRRVIAVRGIDVDVTAGNAVDAREQAVLRASARDCARRC